MISLISLPINLLNCYLGTSILALLIFIKYGILDNNEERINIYFNINEKNNSFIEKMKTAKGNVSFDEILQNVYKPSGFRVEHFSKVIPELSLREQQSCFQIYSEWLNASKTDITPLNNKQELLHDNFTLNGYITMSQCYYANDSYNNEQSNLDKVEATKKWSQENIDGWIKEIKNEKYLGHYIDSVSVYYATKYYNIIGKKGAVIGSINPWVESMCLANGASKIVTIDYQHIKIGHKDIIYLDAFDLVKAREIYFDTFDFIASFSSIEHSGLGRYGDPIDPMGDIREMQKLRCILKPGGLFFLGIPVGQDDVGYNCHRTYGRIRLPLMFAGFKLLNVFYMKPKPIELKVEELEDNHGGDLVSNVTHYVFEIEKVK